MLVSSLYSTSLWAILTDAFIVFLYFVIIIGIGLYAGRNSKTLEEFALGGKSIPWLVVLASIVAAETSAATFLGTPVEGYKTHAFFYAQLAIGTVLARILIAYTFLAPYYRYKVKSIYEFLTVRFGTTTKNTASAIFLFTRVLGIGVRLYLGGLILVVLWHYFYPGAPTTLANYFCGILIITLITTAYTMIGGIKAVVWTDLIQASLMIGSVVISIWLLLNRIGGLGAVKEVFGSWANLQWTQSDWDSTLPFGLALSKMLAEPYTLWAACIGSTFLTMATHGTDQDMVQRLLTAKNVQKSRLSLILSGFADIPLALAFLSVGILLFVYYKRVGAPAIPDNEIFAHFIIHNMPVGLRGLIIASVLATMMGSTSAALNALATSFTTDFYIPYINPSADDRASIRAARMATLIFGIVMIGVGTMAAYSVFLNPRLTIIPIAIGILGYTYGGLLGIFLVGMLTKTRGNDKINLFAMLLGMTSVLFLGKIEIPGIVNFNHFMPAWWPVISWPWYVFIGSIVTICCALPSKAETKKETML